ncbi:DUF1353 domain-containing protein [Pseudonocardia broussonetiae]|uniref:DUF1353 domain-containing protein n=1 Tax=Pseudonocardia broussonetiae TaxID=2736640 RepID=A0A6M6JFB2_9PSEU|nr:DUF1353 domain-containing protein [Pseudonocardia broussonetiae]QJY45783.1 DUF1353 domain-containing protein [Pseudonocardia broussonetiae]
MTFLTGPRVLVRQADDEDWTLEEEVVYQGRTERFVVPVGTRTDFASVPRVFVWLVPKFGRYTAPAVLHDHLVRVERPAGRISAVDADGLFRRAMRELGVPFLLRWFMWAAVRLGSLTDRDGRVGWVRDLPAVLLVTVVALPVVALPAVAIVVGLLVFTALEFLVWPFLLLGRRMRPDSDKAVNRPDPGFST